MRIEKIEYYLPNKVLNNKELKEKFPTWDSEKTETKIGISQRHIAGEDETAVDLAEQAGEKVLEGFDREKIDFVLFCTQSPDHFLPTSACILQDRLKLRKNIGALDFNLGCSGYVYGLSLAKGLIASGTATNVLLLVADTYSKHIYEKDIANLAIFGDGAAATILSITDQDQDSFGKFALGTDGSGKDNLIVKNGAFRSKIDDNVEEVAYGTESMYTDNNLYMNGPEIFNFTIENIPKVVNEVLDKNEMNIDDVDYFVFHQANKYMLNYLRRKMKVPKDKFHADLQNTGNTVSATIPIALKNAITNDLVKKGDKVMLVGFGVGYSWGATIVTI